MTTEPSSPIAPTAPRSNLFASWASRIGAKGRLAVAVAIAIVAYAACNALAWDLRLVATWDASSVAYLILAWTIVHLSDAASTRQHALAQDTSGFLIFCFVVVAACSSVVAIAFVIGTIKGLDPWPKALHLALTVVALTTSWVLIETVFAFHYARRYYHDEEHTAAQEGGLEFPGGLDPDYWDFAYYAFVVGMTSQVSDVRVLSTRMRKLTLVHGVLAFIFNVVVLALSINIIASAI